MSSCLNKIAKILGTEQSKQLITHMGTSLRAAESTDSHVGGTEREESARMKQFHEKLKLQPIPRVGPKERFVDLVLVEVDPDTGDLLTNNEKDPTKWGDWQNGGRVSDF